MNRNRHQRRVPRFIPWLEVLEQRLTPSTNFFETEPNDNFDQAEPIPFGFGPGQDTRVIVHGNISAVSDRDVDRDRFNFHLNAGDTVTIAVKGDGKLDPRVGFLKESPGPITGLLSNDNFPMLPPYKLDTTDSAFWYVVNSPGTYSAFVSDSFPFTGEHSTGNYLMVLFVERPGLEKQPVGTKQIVFVDFNGATTGFFKDKPNDPDSTLSPLSRFLPAWGLTAADENTVIDATMARIRHNFDVVRQLGLNGDYATTHRPGDFDIDIRNSRDNADEYGSNPFTARVVVGGTVAETGFPTIGIASVIDPGNTITNDEAYVFLDSLSAPAGTPSASLNQFAIAPGHTKIELIGRVLGDIASHEMGHLFGNFHTFGTFVNGVFTRNPSDLMDGTGAIFRFTGPDQTFGTADDVDLRFGRRPYLFSPANHEWWSGTEDTLNTIAFGLSTGKGTAAQPAAGSGTASGAGLLSPRIAEAFRGPQDAELAAALAGFLTAIPGSDDAAIVSPRADMSIAVSLVEGITTSRPATKPVSVVAVKNSQPSVAKPISANSESPFGELENPRDSPELVWELT